MKRLRGLLISDPLIILAFVLFGTSSILISFFDRTGNVQVRVARKWAKFLLFVSGIKIRVEGLENINPKESYVFASNHLSYMDTPVVLGYVPVQFRFLAKRGLFEIPFLGHHLKQAGHIPVPREDARAAVKTLQQAAETIQQKKTSLLIFPEGGRSPDAKLKPLKEGGAYIAIRAGVPIVPIVLIGTEAVLPFGSAVALAGVVTLKILAPIPTVGLTLKDRGVLTLKLHAQMADALPSELVAETV